METTSLDLSLLHGLVLDGRFRIRRSRGVGSFGVVFSVDQLVRGESVACLALKIFWPQAPEGSASILQEIRTLASLSHPGVVAYRGAGELREGPFAGCLYLAMELAEESLRDQWTRTGGKASRAEVLSLLEDVARGLRYLHRRGIVHRDVKPDNLLCFDGLWKLGDLGLTRSAEFLHREGPLDGGTWSYMAPEVFGQGATPAVDLWALGVILQEWWTGRYPYPDGDRVDLATHVRCYEPYVTSGLPEPFQWIVSACLLRHPAERLSAAELVEVLEFERAGLVAPEQWGRQGLAELEQGQEAGAPRLIRAVRLGFEGEGLGEELERWAEAGWLPVFDRVRLARLCGGGHLEAGRWARALRILTLAHDLDPEDLETLALVGQVHCARRPRDPQVHESLARLCVELGEGHRGRELYRQAATLWQSRGRKRRARACLQESERLDSPWPPPA